MPKISYINGQFVNHQNAYVHIDDRGYQFADGVYEVVLTKNGRLIDWQPHCSRLRRSLRELAIAYSFCDDSLGALVKELMARNSLDNAIIYIQITRGVAPRAHGFPAGNVTPTVVMTAGPAVFPSNADYEKGVAVITMPDIRWQRRDIKTISLLPNILAKQAASEQNAAEAIFIENDGTITEGSSSNFFIFDANGVLLTHPANNRILGGITRDGILKLARNSGFKVEERGFNLNELLQSHGAFISSTTKHVLPVTKVDNSLVAGGIVSQQITKLATLYKQYIDEMVG